MAHNKQLTIINYNNKRISLSFNKWNLLNKLFLNASSKVKLA